MTYSSFDPSKVDVDATQSLANLTGHHVEQDLQENQKPAEQLPLTEEELQQIEDEQADMPIWRRTLEEGNANPDLISESNMTLEQKAQARIDEMRAMKNSMNPSQFGLTENTIELFDAIKGGAAKTWSSIMTPA